jgi:transcriptional regulator with GAF, ATPase, and Fis domain
LAQALGPLPAARAPEPKQLPSESLAPAANDLSIDAAMVRHIEAALVQTHGRIEGPFGAARLLNINPHTLRGRMRSLGIDWRRFRHSAASNA